MVYRVRVLDRITDEELSCHWVGIEDLENFILQFSTKTNKIVILNDYYNY